MLRDIVRQLGIITKRAAPPGTIRYRALRSLSWLMPRKIRGNYEDNPVAERLHRFAQASRDVFFVQVGAHTARAGDQLSLYIERDGWRGVLVEPVPALFERLRARYENTPGLVFENVAVAEEDGERSFYQLDEAASEVYALADQLGSLDRAVLLSHEDQVPDIEDHLVRIEVPCVSFDTLLRRHAIGRIDVLSLDTEGYDGKLLRSFPWHRLRPRLVAYEHDHLEQPERDATEKLLRELGYELSRSRTNTLGELTRPSPSRSGACPP